MKLKDRNPHPLDSRIEFDEKEHVYYIDNIPYDISVTGFVKSFFEEFDTDDVIQKNYQKWQADKYSKYHGLSVEQIKQMWKENSEDASKKGSILHQDIEDFYNDIDVSNDTIEFSYFLNLHERLKDRVIAYRTEWTIFDEEIQIAGSIDMCYTDDKGDFFIFDWKRSKEITKNNDFRTGKYPLNHLDDANFWHYALQLNIYKYILEKNYSKIISAMRIVRLHPDQEDYEIIKIPDLKNEVNLMLKERLNKIASYK